VLWNLCTFKAIDNYLGEVLGLYFIKLVNLWNLLSFKQYLEKTLHKFVTQAKQMKRKHTLINWNL